ncbi:uncharacterized protein LOC105694743 isoform X1 [Orussus abietinus]|uniref:uncharacterized protein LOC105694743 isoform X1 n=2 Tax=Orussus abietinus TaxID=222816 RepID=UPI000C715B82|nr:uncharacterized protein LOC105694743 isoform X1 [Orussus abietinus]XP_023288225.1 uncharacterized protein LOC105694743 isoform X1 [Orussus abietinus]
MDSVVESFPKRIQTLNNMGLEVNECVREFNLPQQFPSQITVNKSILNKTGTEMNTSSPLSVKFLLGNDTNVSSKLQKLKLKSADGRDLGEFNVQLLSQPGNKLSGKTITIAKQSNKVSVFSVLKSQNAIRKEPNTVELSSRNQCPMKVPSSHGIVSAPRLIETEISLHNIESDSNYRGKISQPKKLVIIQPENSCQPSNGENGGSVHLNELKSNETRNTTFQFNIQRKNLSCVPVGISVPLDTKGVEDKLWENVSKQSNSIIKNKTEGIIKMEISDEGEVISNEIHAKSSILNYGKRTSDSKSSVSIHNDGTEQSFNRVNKRSYNHENHYNKTVALTRPSKVQKIMLPLRTTKISKTAEKQIETCTLIEENEGNSTNLTDNLSIVEEALSSIKNKELREKAFKALADCGIGIERQVPLRPPSPSIVVRNSQTQTQVFGLLDQEDFIAIAGDSGNLKRMKKKDRDNRELSNINFNCDDFLYCDQSNPNLPSLTEEQDLYALFNKEFGNKASTIPEPLLEEPLVSFEQKVYNKLKVDFAMMKQADENGMLGIHRAVLNNDEQEVHRQLLMLKACNEDPDIPSTDGRSSLEVAIEYDVNKAIIQLLLRAGAQPVSLTGANTSALLLACKLCSPRLTDLISFCPREALNVIDTAGFAAIHYCTQNNNVEGITALVEAGADVNIRDRKSGRTSLFHAMEHQNVEAAKVLLSLGAISNVVNFSGQTALSLLENFKNHSLAKAMDEAIV